MVELASGRREVTERDAATGYPLRVELTGSDELGRALRAEGRCLNKLGFHINPSLFTVNYLTEWRFAGITAYGEDHDNWSAPAARAFFRERLGYGAR